MTWRHRGGRRGATAAWLAVFWATGCGGDGGGSGRAVRREVGDIAGVRAPLEAPHARVTTTTGWLDLLAQRSNAVRLVEGRVVVDLASRSARAHLVPGAAGALTLGTSPDGRAVGRVRGRALEVYVPIDGDLAPQVGAGTDDASALALALAWRALVEDQRVTVTFNGRPLAHLAAGTSWERRTFSLPPDLVRPGENRVALHLRRLGPQGGSGLAVERLEVGPIDTIRGGAPVADGVTFSGGAAGPVQMRLDRGEGIAWYLVPPRRGGLVLRVRGHGRIEVRASTDEDHREGRPPRSLLASPLRPTWTEHRLDLSGFGGDPVRIELRVSGTRPGDHGRVDRLRIEVPRTRPLARYDRSLRDVVVIAVEGARADDVIPRDGDPPHGVFRRLADGGRVFDGAHAMAPWAVPNHAALLTSIPPFVHRTSRGTVVADTVVTLAEHLERAGYQSVLVTTNPDVHPDRGLAQGFDRYVFVPPRTDRSPSNLALEPARRALASGPSGAPRFLYLVVNDPQPPFDPPRERIKHLSVPEGAPLPHLTHVWLERVRLGRVDPTPAQLAYVRKLYRAELATVGDAVEVLLGGLLDGERRPAPLVVLVGMHGEEFYEHGAGGHGRSLYEEILRVPLVLHAPGLIPPGRVAAPVDLIDVAPTILDLLGLPPPPGFRGVSLLPLATDPVPPPRAAQAYAGDGSRAMVGTRFKLIAGPGRRSRFFDLVNDPTEQRNLGERGGIALRLFRAAQNWHDAEATAWRRARWGFGVALDGNFGLDQGL